ncbi:hypothetical protein [Nocardioides yefusunii]|uniref:HK97 gp10 family phage protein n=1 Tax=Nocardioides yefusunii TaxID=2500546 RepID=A0ABW1QVU9_9ACTN|nr:hypothetical protein [Nocardioides yefusunii]
MASPSGIYIEGLRETTRAFERAGVDVEDLKDVMGRVAGEHADTLARLVPVGSAARGSKRPGALRDSVRGNRAKGRAQVLIGRARVPYAGAINYGWPKRGIKPANFIARADDVMGTRAVEILTDGWNEIAERNGLL